MRSELGDEYVEKHYASYMMSVFQAVQILVTYWYEKARDAN